MILRKLIPLIFLLISLQPVELLAGEHYNDLSLSGKIISSTSGEPITGATILVEELNRGTATDTDGHFIIRNLEEGTYTLVVRAVGFTEKKIRVTIPTEGIAIELKPDIIRPDDVIITASPVGKDIHYQSAQAFNVRELQDMQSSSFGEMLDGQPGIAMRSFGPAPSRPVIRGFDGDRLLILENGERMGDLSNTAHDHNISLDPLVAERVEVVRGPASLLYGSSALGGVVNIITSDIPRGLGNRQLGYGSHRGFKHERYVQRIRQVSVWRGKLGSHRPLILPWRRRCENTGRQAAGYVYPEF